MDKPKLGLATTRQLLDELRARIEVDGKLDYRTVGDLAPGGEADSPSPTEPERELPKDKRVIRTKSTGDRVYLIDEVAKTKQWVTAIAPKTGPDTLKDLGFEMSDVEDVEDSSLVGYRMDASIDKVD